MTKQFHEMEIRGIYLYQNKFLIFKPKTALCIMQRVELKRMIVLLCVGPPFYQLINSYAKKRSHGKFPGTCHKQLEPINLFSDLANKPWWPYLWTSFFCFVFAISPFDGSVSQEKRKVFFKVEFPGLGIHALSIS